MRMLYLGTFGKHCSDNYRLKGFREENINYISADYRKIFEQYGIKGLRNSVIHWIYNYDPDVILINKGEKFTSELMELLTSSFNKIKWWLFYGDQRKEFPVYLKNNSKYFDAILVSNNDKNFFDSLYEYGAKKVIYHHSATDLDVFYKNWDIEEIYDIGFFGTNYNDSFPDSRKRQQYIVRMASKYRVICYGNNWGRIGKPMVYGKDYSFEASKCKLLFGINAFNDINEYCSNRLFNSMACGTHLTYYFKGIENMFKNGTHLLWFKTEKQLFDLIDMFLNSKGNRKRIYEIGRNLLEKKHTYRIRAKHLKQLYEEIS